MRAALILIFTASGFAGLMYESVWSHYLRILVGAAAYAQSLVVAVFLGGMALGAWYASRSSARRANLLRSYAKVEAALGFFALAFHPLFLGVRSVLFSPLLAPMAPEALMAPLRWAAAVGLILPPSVLLGFTFPLMVGSFVRRFPDRAGAAISVLYAANALGGVAGVLTGGFGLLAWIGLPGTVAVAGLVNLVVAGVAWQLSEGASEAGHVDPTRATRQERPSAASDAEPGTAKILLAVAGLTGLASLVYEIAWIRMLSFVLSSSSHAFELMLSAFILGIGLGGLGIRGRLDNLHRPLRFLALVQIAMGFLAVATLPIYARLFPLMQRLLEGLPATDGGYALFNVASHGMAMAVMLPATFCAGMTLPLITHALLRAGHGERSIGQVYAANTVGAVVGALMALHWLLPAVGLVPTLALAAALDVALGVFLVWTCIRAQGRRVMSMWAVTATAGGAAIAVLVSVDPAVLTSGVYRRHIDLAVTSQDSVLEHRDGKTASVSLVQTSDGTLSIRTNGKPSSSMAVVEGRDPTGDEAVSTLLGALPLVLKPDARTALNIGMGSGITSHTLLTSETMASVTTVEIEPAMVELARGFAPRNERALTDPRSRIVIQDARAFLAGSRDLFDVIVTQPFNPWVSGAGSLYSEEFYAAVARRLAPDGLVVQWIQLFETGPDVVASVLRALSLHFPSQRAYAGATGDLLVVASPTGPIPALDPSALASPALAAALGAVDVRTLQDFAVRTAGDQSTLAALLDLFPGPASSELRPRLERQAARARFIEESAEEALRLMVQPIPVMELLGVVRPDWSTSDATPSPTFFYSSRPTAAIAFRDLAVLGQEPSQEGSAFERRARDDALRFQHDCAYQGFGQDALPALYGVASALVTDLRPSELEAVWKGIETWSCITDLDETGVRWLDFFKAMGRREVGEIEALAIELLRYPSHLTPARSRYLVASGMLARMALGRGGEALALWEAYRSALFEDPSDPSFLFLHLAQLARRQTGS